MTPPDDRDPWGSEPVSAWLLWFVCPRCRGDLEATDSALRCPTCALRYPVVDGVPCLAEDHAEPG